MVTDFLDWLVECNNAALNLDTCVGRGTDDCMAWASRSAPSLARMAKPCGIR